MSTSGAHIAVVKTAPAGKARERLRAQATWLLSHSHPGLVKVTAINEDGYEMEILSHVGSYLRASSVISVLQDAVWCHESDAIWSPAATRQYVHALEYGTELNHWLTECLVKPEALRFCDTHGDPTFENVMARGGQYVLIDPLPDVTLVGKLPSLRALDLGKVLQSVLGYENVKLGRAAVWDWNAGQAEEVEAVCASEDEWRLACCFAAIHVARFIPYQTPGLAARWRSWFPDIIEFLKKI